MDDFARPHAVPLQGSALARRVLGWLGWRLHIDGLPAKQGVIIVYPHTSNWDFVYLVIAKWAAGLSLKFWGKDSLFAIPVLGHWLRWLGGVPVDRSSPHGMVGEMVRTLHDCRSRDQFFWLALTPEGTRKWTPGWRSGFYQVALNAGVPLGICRVNYADKTVHVLDFLQLSGQREQDMQRIAQALGGSQGKHPALAAPIQLLSK